MSLSAEFHNQKHSVSSFKTMSWCVLQDNHRFILVFTQITQISFPVCSWVFDDIPSKFFFVHCGQSSALCTPCILGWCQLPWTASLWVTAEGANAFFLGGPSYGESWSTS